MNPGERTPTDPSLDRPSLGIRVLQRVVAVEPNEVRALLWSCAYFFCVLSSYFILRPLREEVGIAEGTDKLPYLWTGTLAGMALANPLFSYLVSRYPRRVFLPWTYRFFAANLLVFFALLKLLPADRAVYVGRVFYCWLSVFNLFAISVFWGFMADIFKLEQGKRLFGFIGVGGSLGAIAGSWFTGHMIKTLGGPQLLIVSLVLLELAVQCVRRLVALSHAREDVAQPAPARVEPAPQLERKSGTAFSGIALVFSMPYLQGIALYTIFYTLSSSFLYFQQANIVHDSIAGRADRTALFAHIDLYVNCLTLLMQCFATGRIVAWLGITFTLVAQPVLTGIGFAWLGLWKSLPALPDSIARAFAWSFGIESHSVAATPAIDSRLAFGLLVVVMFQILFRSVNQGTAKPARETLYTVVDREVKYKSKSFNDTFIYRTGDLIAAWSFTWLNQTLEFGLTAIAYGTVPLAVVWLITGLLLGRKQLELAHERADARPHLAGATEASAS
jgi:AAA family ATP:ADP antiporter